ncbi:CGNR zinc finger domain-containing protein [Dictyobacter formicarum]|nr:CGNR zinc finger domain-containing protein [Dictyobacter formicarum]
MIWLDLVNTDWHDYRGSGRHEDRLLRPGMIEQLLEHWDIEGMERATEETIAELQRLRALIQRIIHTLLEKRLPDQDELVALNDCFAQAPTRLLVSPNEQQIQLRRVPCWHDWPWVYGEIAASFAHTLAERDPFRIKQCENPDCRWVYYDESSTASRRWCEDPCANIMRVRRYRARHRPSSS